MTHHDNTTRRLLVISIWDRMWALDGEAGVSDDFHFVTGFTAAGWDVHFLAPRSHGGGDPFPGVTLHTYPNFFAATRWLPRFLKRLLWLPLFRVVVERRALRLARRIRPAFILGHSHYTAPVTARCRRELGIPSGVKLFGVMDLVHTHWSRARYTFKNLEQLVALRHAQLVWIVLDDGTRGDEVLARLGIAPGSIRFLPNGLDLQWQGESFDRSAARSSLGLGEDDEVVLFLSRLVPSKRPAHAIRAAAQFMRARGAARLVIAGDGPELGACRRMVEGLGLGDRVLFTGSVAHARVPELMAAADVFVSTSSLTNMALPTCEALICGVPVVAYDAGDTGRIVRDRETGRLVPDGDIRALAQATSDLLADRAERERMARRAAALARELFTSWEERIAMERGIIESLTRDSAGAKKEGGG